MLKRMLSITQQYLIPPRCPLCQTQINIERPLCHACRQKLTQLTAFCYQCGFSPTQGDICGQCLTCPPPFQRFIGNNLFEKTLKKIIHDYKYHQRLYLAPVLANLLLPTILSQYEGLPRPMSLVPVPSHPKKTRSRGFNPILEITKTLATESQIPIQSGVKRIQYGLPQSQLPLKYRAKNIKGAFMTTTKLPAHIAIIDDVMTSGATINELARTLRQHGARKIDIWILARTLKTA